ncbi:hypothetical protein MXAN_5395 [Myxococcus xanthus DK 1622]|uniref:Uncharacterized protein n=1 Tax=Myxococcus xanthus (strain DK1622) TaxID=246197 RepID=Q1D1D1_MYXXD|nr:MULTISPECIES: hypothetical protein [Myxococcus]ABF88478.1 hypothetical protein MXAN_5395 [Myxococcus xanthus DK 1622]NOJ57579.1 hypothetical protein [Myxococcus xanthus]QPM77858.1 hypothetical protein I5Q59_26665 [Myxococcus xanthus]QVW66925.1 hypothetical protein JTM82_32015 [Myxococcus xanthus DZ2]QZZ53047.1 hypothetical protein MyxoNM_27930 [Myxococcus xanthus]
MLLEPEPGLAAVGPVGFWLANSLGPTLALVIAVGWPALLGVLTTRRAARNLAKADLVG